jgi:hypothetical protein
MRKLYEPELGQAMFGQPSHELECPDYLEVALCAIRDTLETIMGLPFNNPFSNGGGHFSNGAFEVHAYSWDDSKEQPFNFKCGDVEVSWYKYMGRGMSVPLEYTMEEVQKMFRRCIKSLI